MTGRLPAPRRSGRPAGPAGGLAAEPGACTPDCIESAGPAGRGAVCRLLLAVRTAAAVLPAAAVIRLLAVGTSPVAVRRGSWALHQASRLLVGLLGVRVVTAGRPRSGPALVIGNHVSFLDILVLAAAAPMRQVAKAETADWPVIGAVGRAAGTIEVNRERWRELPQIVERIGTALRQGHKVQVFPEATTRCGRTLGTFHRSLFQAAIDAAVAVAPVTVRYTDAVGAPTARPAFLGDETLFAALHKVLALRGLTVRVHWLPAVPAIAGTGRRAIDRARLARSVHRAIAADLQVSVDEIRTEVANSTGITRFGRSSGPPARIAVPA